jgi:hypothetical protein
LRLVVSGFAISAAMQDLAAFDDRGRDLASADAKTTALMAARVTMPANGLAGVNDLPSCLAVLDGDSRMYRDANRG